jgi:hypothetical protein
VSGQPPVSPRRSGWATGRNVTSPHCMHRPRR